jgi:hypothetical protein
MKIFHPSSNRRQGFALLLVMILIGVSLVILAAAMSRSSAISVMNQRNNEYNECTIAAEAAVEKAFAILAFQFQGYGVAGANGALTAIRTNIPLASEYGYMTNYIFSDGAGNSNQTHVDYAYTYSGYLPSAYSGLFTTNAPVYRIVSNVQKANSQTGITGTAQEDVLLALVPLTTWAIFYNGLLEFSTCAPMIVNGAVHANGAIYYGSGSSLVFNGDVSSTLNISSPKNNGQGPWTTKNDNTDFNSQKTTNAPSVTVTLNMTNSHFLIDIPPDGEDSMSSMGQQRLYNQAQMILIVTNGTGVGAGTNPTVIMTLQTGNGGNNPGSDSAKVVSIVTNANPAVLTTNFPFLSLTNSFYDQRELKTTETTDIDVGKLATWMQTTNVQNKIPATSGLYPTILYVADRRPSNSSLLPVVRLNKATKLPSNNGMGFSVATQNPLYVDGSYNTQIAGSAGSSASTTNTAYTVPAALLSDSLTILSGSWDDSKSTQSYTKRDATDTTINAAIITGTVPSTGTGNTTFSGGVHNLTRLLEDWSGNNLYLNTSILRLFDSQMATHQFVNPGTYYQPPTRQFSFDLNFLNPAKVPPGVPTALVPIRFGWTTPPPGTVTYNSYTHN